MVFDIVAGLLIGYAIIFLVKLAALMLLGQQQAAEQAMEEGDDVEDSSENAESPMLFIDVKLEEIEGQWYGWAQLEDGKEMFLGQGVTKQEAIEVCTDRLVVDTSYNYVVKYIE